jgi:arginine deiminase
MRDQLIVTDRGVVLGQFAEDVRNGEQAIVELALSRLGIIPNYRVAGSTAVLEGGDFIPAGNWGLFGSGFRSNYCDIRSCPDHGICQLLSGPGAHALGFPNVAVIKDPTPTRQEMHLDTYFMLVSPDTCLVVETRVDPPIQSMGDRRPTVDIYEKSSTAEDYNLLDQDRPFEDFLLHDLGVSSLVRLTEEDQKAYGINVLCLDTNKIVGSYSKDQDTTQKQTYEQKLSAAGISFNLLDFTNIRKGYGSNHCMSQVLIRG